MPVSTFSWLYNLDLNVNQLNIPFNNNIIKVMLIPIKPHTNVNYYNVFSITSLLKRKYSLLSI